MSEAKSVIRFGIICKDPSLKAWQAQCIDNLLALGNTELVLLIVIDDKTNLPKPLEHNLFHAVKNIRFRSILFQIYMKYFCKPRATRPGSMQSLLLRVPQLRCTVIQRGKLSQYFSKSDITIIRGYDLDFILHFGFRTIRGDIFNAANYGIWSFHHDDEKKYRGGPSCFWEMYKGDPVTGAILKRITKKLDGRVVLKKGFFKTTNYSYAKNIDQVYFESAKWPADVCRDISNNNIDYLNASPSQTQSPTLRLPTNFQFSLFLVKMCLNFLKNKIFGFLFNEDWNIGIVSQPIHTFLALNTYPKIFWYPKSKKYVFMADPFAIARDEKIHLFFEEFDYRSCKKNIACMEIMDHDFSSTTKSVPNLLKNASYPYLLEHQGEIFCIPETWRSKEISLYKAEEFPNKWVKVCTLVKDISAIDSTVFQYEGKWWLACTIREEDANLNLFLWYAADLFGPWRPHVANPVKTDIRSSRSAGTPFSYNGDLYRPAQDCSRTYGGGIVINRVLRLTPTAFEEEAEAVIEPFANYPYTDGIHTISSIGNITVVDGKRYVFILCVFKHFLMKKLKGSGRNFLKLILV